MFDIIKYFLVVFSSLLVANTAFSNTSNSSWQSQDINHPINFSDCLELEPNGSTQCFPLLESEVLEHRSLNLKIIADANNPLKSRIEGCDIEVNRYTLTYDSHTWWVKPNELGTWKGTFDVFIPKKFDNGPGQYPVVLGLQGFLRTPKDTTGKKNG